MTWGSCWKQTEKISAWFLAGSGAGLCERSRLLLSPCLLPGGVSPVGDIALRTPPIVRGLRPLAAERAAVGARGAAGKGVKNKRAAVFSQGAKVEGAKPDFPVDSIAPAALTASTVIARSAANLSFACLFWLPLFPRDLGICRRPGKSLCRQGAKINVRI